MNPSSFTRTCILGVATALVLLAGVPAPAEAVSANFAKYAGGFSQPGVFGSCFMVLTGVGEAQTTGQWVFDVTMTGCVGIAPIADTCLMFGDVASGLSGSCIGGGEASLTISGIGMQLAIEESGACWTYETGGNQQFFACGLVTAF